MKRFLLLAITTIVMVGCSNFAEQDALPSKVVGIPDTIYATFDEAEADSRTYVEQGKYLRWNEGDEISFFPVTYNMQYRFKGKTGDNNGAFEKITTDLVTGNELKNNYAVYPYKASTAMSDEGVISFELPAVQHYAENSFGVGANTMVAITSGKDDNILRFKNCGGYLKLQLYGDATVKSIELKGNNGEKIAGASTITAVYGGEPSVAMADGATTSITLDCGDGVALGATADAATAFWFVVPPTTFENGFTVTVTNTEGAIFEKSTSNTTTIDRNTIQPMAEVEVKCAPVGPANNEIWYTSSNGKIVPPYSGYNNNYATALQTFGANIVSNTYENGMGVITFDAPVTLIGEDAFSYCESLTSVTIGNSVTSIGSHAFDSCTLLTSVTIPDSVILIGGRAFSNCTSLTSITIPDSITSIGAGAFSRCTSLTSVAIPDSVTSIGENPFIWCTSLEAFYGKFASSDNRCLIVNGVLNSFAIGCGATEYTIPNSVTSIGNSAFYGCRSLTSVTIPDSVTSIRDYAFYGCRSLTSITIPDSVTSIGWGAFEDCISLKEVYCKPTTPPTGGDYMFHYNAKDRKIYVPTESVEAYKAAKYWSDYASYIEGYDF